MSNNGQTNNGSNDPQAQMYAELQKGILSSLTAGVNAEKRGEKPTNFMGFEVDPWMAGIGKIGYSYLSDWVSGELGDRIFWKAYGMAGRNPTLQPMASKVAAVATFGTAMALKSGAYLLPFYQSWAKHSKEREELAHKLAPVLDKLKGGHSAFSLMRVSVDDNQMIYAHRKRMALIAHNDNANNLIDLGVMSGGNLLFDFRTLGGTWKHGVAPGDLAKHDPKLAIRQPQNTASHAARPASLSDMLQNILKVGTGPIATLLQAKNKKKVDDLPKFSTLEMVFNLEDQVLNNAKSKLFKLPGDKGREVPLEEYLVQVMIHHQQEMAELDPKYSKIHDSLKEDLALVAKPLAKVIRSGEINALALVRLIGEGHIIKAQGRVIASAEEVEALLERSESKKEHKLHQNPKDYYATSAFTRDDLKAALKALDGDEKLLVASWFSDAMLEDAGLEAKEIKGIREATCAHYETMLLEVFSGVAAKSDEELKADGLAVAEIRHVREAQKKLQAGGEKAIHELRESPANPHGVERILANLMVPKLVLGEREYLGRVVEAGREKLASQDNEKPSENGKEHKAKAEKSANNAKHDTDSHQKSHEKHENVREMRRAANDDHPKPHVAARPAHHGRIHDSERHLAG